MVSLALSVRREMPRLGGRKLYHLLQADLQGFRGMGRDKFLGLLKEHDLLVGRKRSYTRTTDSRHRFRRYGNLLKNMTICGSEQAWASDITYIHTKKGFVYLSLITDLYSRKIVGWSLSRSLSVEGSLEALEKALQSRRNKSGKLVHHSDRGIQYCCHEYVSLLQKHHVLISMTEENHCYENSLAERVNGILKDEFLLNDVFNDYDEALKAVRYSINTYNNRRPHWALGLKTPKQVHEAG